MGLSAQGVFRAVVQLIEQLGVLGGIAGHGGDQGVFLLDDDGVLDDQALSGLVGFFDPRVGQRIEEGLGGPVQRGDFQCVQFDQEVVDVHPGDGGEAVLTGLDDRVAGAQ